VTVMSLCTPRLLNTIARAEYCGWQKFSHLDATFNWYSKDFRMIGLNM
jgi:hypothetical protein